VRLLDEAIRREADFDALFLDSSSNRAGPGAVTMACLGDA
jgi:hypothetical protein